MDGLISMHAEEKKDFVSIDGSLVVPFVFIVCLYK